jgi:hypothetical protein
LTYERAKDFADRLPPIVPKEETDLSHLDEEMRELLYPSREPKPFRMGVVFDDFEAAESGRAMELAKSASAYRAFRDGSRTRHRAEFETREANRLRDLVSLVGNRRGTDVLVGGKKAPYGRELWLPLFYLFVTGD